MRMPSIAIAIAATLLSGAVGAGPEPAPRATAQQIFDVAGTYQLDNGERAELLALDNRLYIEIGRHRQELVLAAPDRFQTADGSITMRFDPDAPGERIEIGFWRGAREPIALLLASGKPR